MFDEIISLLQELARLAQPRKIPWNRSLSALNEEAFFVCITRIKSAGRALFWGPGCASVRAVDELEHLVEKSRGAFGQRLINSDRYNQLIAELQSAMERDKHLLDAPSGQRTPVPQRDAIIEAAQREAQRIIEEAREEADQIIARAKRESPWS